MKSWLAAANLMYRHVFVNSLASSASSTSSRMIDRSRLPKVLRPASPRARCAHDDDLGQRAQLFERLPFGDALRTERHVDRRPAGDQLLDHRGDARVHRAAQHQVLAVAQVVEQALDGPSTPVGSGLRCSSTGVPTTTTTCSALGTQRDRLSRRAGRFRACARASRRRPPRGMASSRRAHPSTARSARSYSMTDRPASAKAMPSGSPTRPHPPTIATSRENGITPPLGVSVASSHARNVGVTLSNGAVPTRLRPAIRMHFGACVSSVDEPHRIVAGPAEATAVRWDRRACGASVPGSIVGRSRPMSPSANATAAITTAMPPNTSTIE